jgi:hypothetical protein
MAENEEHQTSAEDSGWGVYVPPPEEDAPATPAPATAPTARGRRGPRAVVLAAGAVAAAAIAVVLVLVLGGGSGLSGNIVARAAAASGGEHGYRFALDEEITAPGQHASITATGTYSQDPETQSTMSLTENGTTLTARVVGTDEYIERSPTSWAKLDLAAFEQTLGVSSQGLVGQDPGQLLNFLLSTGSVTRVGSETVRGTSTTHYSAVAQLSRVAAASPAADRAAAASEARLLERLTGGKTLPVDAWIDDQQRVRRVRITLPSVCTKAGTFHETVTLDYFSYGPQPPVQAPPDSQVTDVTNQAEATLRQQMQQFCTAS